MNGNFFNGIQIELIDGRDWTYQHDWGGNGLFAIRDDFSRLYLLKSGRAEVRTGGQTISLSPGMTYLFPAGKTAWYKCIEPMRLCWVHFRLEHIQGISFFDHFQPDNEVEQNETALEDFQLMIAGLEDSGQMAFFSSLQALLRQLSGFLPQESVRATHPTPEMIRLKPVLDYLSTHFAEPELSLKKMAKIVHLQPTYFSNLFKKHLGKTPIQVLTEYRMRNARFLLLNSDKTVNEISTLCGYSDQFYFTRAFKKNTGQSPRQFRNSPRLFGIS